MSTASAHGGEPAPIRDTTPPPRPVLTLGVIGATLGILGLLLLPFALVPLSKGSWLALNFTHLPGEPRSATWGLFTWTTLGLLLSILLFIGSVGCLAWRRWARPVMVAYAVLSLVVGTLGSIFFLRWSFGLLGRETPLLVGPDALIPAAGCFLGLIFAAFTLYYMTRPYVKEQFRHAPSFPANLD